MLMKKTNNLCDRNRGCRLSNKVTGLVIACIVFAISTLSVHAEPATALDHYSEASADHVTGRYYQAIEHYKDQKQSDRNNY